MVNAQAPSSIDGIDISISPDNPVPKSAVEVKVESYITDLNSASVLWIVDGKNFSKGTGIKSIQVPAPEIGKTKTVNAVIQTSEGREVRKTIVIKSGDIDLIWENRGYVPTFFKGKAGFAYQNTLRITAIPHLSSGGATEISPSDLVYKWKVGEKVYLDQSGFGRQFIDLESGDIPKQLDITVTVSSRDGRQQTIGQISLEPNAPSIIFYEIDPLYGIFFNKEIKSTMNLKNSETTVLASLFGFNKNDKLTYTWSINNVEQPELTKNQSITLRTKGDVEGSSDIDLEIRNTDSFLQSARSAFTALFKKKAVEETNTTF